MPTVFSKLNLKDQKQILILNPPASFESEIASLKGVDILRDLKRTKTVAFSLAFVTRQAEVDRLAPAVTARAGYDAVIWFAYPKGTSKKYKSQISRDNGWNAMGVAGYEPVRMIAIDEDWSAIRFRRAALIKIMKRAAEHRLTERVRTRSSIKNR